MEARLTDLEIQVTHQERLIEELNGVVFEQQQQIERLSVELELLKRQVLSLAPSDTRLPSEEEPPPHY